LDCLRVPHPNKFSTTSEPRISVGKKAMTKHILAAIGILATTYPAQAQNVIPPEEFDHPFGGTTRVWRSSDQAEIKAKCPPSAFPYHLGCGGKSATGQCHILMADDETIRKHGWTPEIVLRHEIGHCNGWPPNHKGARKP
jgi:hypothetical protein